MDGRLFNSLASKSGRLMARSLYWPVGLLLFCMCKLSSAKCGGYITGVYLCQTQCDVKDRDRVDHMKLELSVSAMVCE